MIDEYKAQLRTLQKQQIEKSEEELFAELRPLADELREGNKDQMDESSKSVSNTLNKSSDAIS